jgi:hypothetical protein
MVKKIIPLLMLALITGLFIWCSSPQNPYENPGNAKINTGTSLSNIKDSLKTGIAYSCTVNVILPALVDSIAIYVKHNGADSVFYKDTVKGLSRIIFSFSSAVSGSFDMQAVIIKNNGTLDSFPEPKQFIVYNPLSPEILSLRPSADSFGVSSSAFPCSVTVIHQYLADSFAVMCLHNNNDSMVTHGSNITSGTLDTGHIVFSFLPAYTGNYRIRVYIYTADILKDSLVKNITIKSIPAVTPLTTSYKAYIGDSVTVKFHVMASDSNLLGYYTALSLDSDTSKSHRVDVTYSALLKISNDTITRTFKGNILKEGFKKPLVCYAQAVDRRYTYSEIAICTVNVADTTKPVITLLPPHVNSGDSVVQLPDSLIVEAVDAFGIDSVTLNNVKMTMINETTAKKIVSSLSKGVTADTIIAWDKARNSDTLILTLKYGGDPTYPPSIKSIEKSVKEGHGFDTLFLDTLVNITDTSVKDTAAYKAALTWIITDSAGNSISYNTATRKLVVPVSSDSEWTDTFNLNFKVIDRNNQPDSRVGTFMVQEVADTPQITMDTLYSKYYTKPFDTLFLDTCARDPDNDSNTLVWSFKNGNYLKVDSIMSFSILSKHLSSGIKIIPRFFTRRIAIIPDTSKGVDSTWTGSDTLQFTATDPTGLSQTKKIVFKKIKLIIIHSSEDLKMPGIRGKD